LPNRISVRVHRQLLQQPSSKERLGLLGSARLSTGYTDQTVANDTSYAPYGEAYNNATSADFNFTGMMQDTGGALYDFPYREYSTVGRWISPDPSGLNAVDPTNPQTWNRYAYVMNNPLNNVDPLGLQAPVTMTNTQCANAQNPAICQGGYGTPGNLWATLGGSGGTWDEFGGITTTTTTGYTTSDGTNVQATVWYQDAGGYWIPINAGSASNPGSITFTTQTNTWNIGSGGNPFAFAFPPGMNGAWQAARQAARGTPKVSPPPTTTPANTPPPKWPGDFQSEFAKLFARAAAALADTLTDITVVGNPCVTSPTLQCGPYAPPQY
jgi:RHS repeat-associated protein